MRRVLLIPGLVGAVALLGWEIYGFFSTQENLRYYSSRPARLLYVLLIGVGGGLIALGISRLSPASQRRLKLIALGTVGSVLAIFPGLAAFYLPGIAAMTPDRGIRGWAVVACLGLAAVSGLIWLEFRRAWKEVQEQRRSSPQREALHR